MTFLNAIGFLAFAAAAPLVLLYILKFRRQRKVVASTMLWQQVVVDLRANTPFQKLRRNLLLLLQIAILALLAVALAAPVISATLSDKKKFVILIIDSSASMQAIDADGARLDAAKSKARDVIGSLPAGAEVMVIDAGDQPLVVGNFTPDRSIARRAVDEIKAKDAEGKIADAITLAYNNLMGMRPKGAQESALPPGEIYLFSDGSNVALPDLKDLDRIMRFIKTGATGNNLGITAFSARMAPGGKGEQPSFTVSVEVANATDTDRGVHISLYTGEKQDIISSQAMSVLAGKSEFAFFAGMQFDFSEQDAVNLIARIEQDSGDKDDLAADDTAYAVVRKPRPLKVLLVSEGSPAIERYFEINTATALTKLPAAQYDASKALDADLVVFDHFVPGTLPKCDCLFVEPETTLDQSTVIEETTRPPASDWNAEDPLFDHVEFDNLEVLIGHPFPVEAGDEALLRSTKGALILRRTVDDAVYVILGFDPHFSSWAQSPGFVIFMENYVNSVFAHRQIGSARNFKAGEPVEFDGNTERAGECQATAPDGHTAPFTATGNRLHLYDTSQAGFYKATIVGLNNSAEQCDFGVSTVSRVETMNAPADKMDVSGGGEIAAVAVPRSNMELWPFIAMAAVLIILVEWWAFTRKS